MGEYGRFYRGATCVLMSLLELAIEYASHRALSWGRMLICGRNDASYGYRIVIGKRDHVEVRGLIGDFPDASVIEETPDIESLPSVSAFGVVAQTTQPIDRVRRLVDELKTNRPEAVVHFRDTVCQPTKNRQEALRALLSEVDAVAVIGGKNSNNTLQLLSTCRKAGTPSFHIERVEELTPNWFKGFETVGVTAGTSTLRETVETVRAWLNRL